MCPGVGGQPAWVAWTSHLGHLPLCRIPPPRSPGPGEPHPASTRAPPFSVMSWVVRSPARSLIPAAQTTRGFPCPPLPITGAQWVPGAPPVGAVCCPPAACGSRAGPEAWGAEVAHEAWQGPGDQRAAWGPWGTPESSLRGGADSRLWGHLWLERGTMSKNWNPTWEAEPGLTGVVRGRRG